jgi:hypothetical protein
MYIFPELKPAAEVDTSTNRGFWRRQFVREKTTGHLVFDLTFGVVAPIACFIFDPIVFQPGSYGSPLLPSYQTLVYLFSGSEILLLCFWLVMGEGHELSNAVIGGVLVIGGSFCLLIGFVLLPFSVMGLVFGIGVFGFIPFLTAIVYLGNGLRALRAKADPASRFTRSFGFLCGAVVMVTIPGLLGWQIQTATAQAVDDVLHGDSLHVSNAVHRLTVLRFFASSELDRIVQSYISEKDEERKQALRSSYREITGADIETLIRVVD